MLGVGDAIEGMGAITMIAWFEAFYAGGFAFAWWDMVMPVVILAIALSGWIQYRYRETRAMTMAQFMEMRYSKRFRIFAGIVIFLSGTINFGIFPAVGARFFLYYCQLPSHLIHLGPLAIDLTYAMVMIILLVLSLFFTLTGGQIAVIVTDFIQGTACNILLCITVGVLLVKFPWSDIVTSMLSRPAEQSLLHPFHSSGTKDFNGWYYMIQAFGVFYTFMAWQGNQGYFSAATNAHEARMGKIIGSWRIMTQRLMIIVFPICAYAFYHLPSWSARAAQANAVLDNVGGEALRNQLTTTVALTQILPQGVMGGFCAVMLMAFIATHNTYLHSWGSIFIQDIVMPFRKTPLPRDTHMKLLRCSIIGVAVFIFMFSLLFAQNDSILFFFALTGTIWLGGAGAVIVGGLYWKRGTTAGAYGAIIVGIIGALLGFFLPIEWKRRGMEFPLNSQWIWLLSMLTSSAVYVTLSLLSRKPVCDMDKLLHRGVHANPLDAAALEGSAPGGLMARLGVDRHFTKMDKVIFLGVIGFSILWGATFLAGTLYNLFNEVSVESWAKFWRFYVILALTLGVFTTIWLSVGGFIDMRNMFKRLMAVTRSDKDDGTVS